MKICFPVEKDEGLASIVFDHFGSAPFFLVFDTETETYIKIENQGRDHLSGSCTPVTDLDGYPVDAIIAMGIGAGSLIGLSKAGFRIYQAQGNTIKENLTLWKDGLFKKIIPVACSGHGSDKN